MIAKTTKYLTDSAIDLLHVIYYIIYEIYVAREILRGVTWTILQYFARSNTFRFL